MNGLLKRIWYKLASLEIFSRRYYTYKDNVTNFYYIKTRKLFCIPRYIWVDSYNDIFQTIWKHKAIRSYEHTSIEQINATIQEHRSQNKPPTQLRYERINFE